MRTINVNDGDFDTFNLLKHNRKQDTSRADTFHYLLTFHAEMQEFKLKPRHEVKLV